MNKVNLVIFLLIILLIILGFVFYQKKDHFDTLNSTYISLASNANSGYLYGNENVAPYYPSQLYKETPTSVLKQLVPSGVIGSGPFLNEFA